MPEIQLAELYAQELKSEAGATRKCLERIPDNLYKYKPHEKSMELGYLALLVAEIPKWIALMITDSVIDFATYKNFEIAVKALDHQVVPCATFNRTDVVNRNFRLLC